MIREWTATAARGNITAADGIAAFHRDLLAHYGSGSPGIGLPTPDWVALLRFNGVYALTGSGISSAAFFAVDANVVYASGVANTHMSLLVSLDGKTSQRIDFTGSFDGTTLTQAATPSGFGVNLTFGRSNLPASVMAACSGTITLAGGTPVMVSGVTYNNPIPYQMFQGTYFLSTATDDANPIAKIAPDYQLSYAADAGGALTPVDSYVYNMNMYYFAFGPDQSIKLIMGTASAKGLACNNMFPDASGALQSRMLLTIPNPQTSSANAKELAALSGLYLLPTIAPGAFLSIQGQYQFALGTITGYSVDIGLSLDGNTSRSFTFNDTMTFANGRLTIPNVADVTFMQALDPETGVLSTLTGTVGSYQNVQGVNYLNPVPMSAFGGATMTTASGTDPLVIEGDAALSFNGQQMFAGVYVPLMYIAAGLTTAGEWMMSFGSGGTKGNACIVTSMPSAPAGTVEVVSAIPNG